MEKQTLPKDRQHGGNQAQILYVDGYKVTIAYSEEKNPPAARAIKDTLLNCGISYGKS